MPRRSLERRRRAEAPDDRTAEQYLLRLPGRQLHHHPESAPSVDSPHLFDNARPLELEIGCGDGDFLCFLAARDPGANFVGVELHPGSLHRAVATAATRGLDNIRFLQADFTRLYPLLAPAALRAVYLHFPDPNLRTKFRKRRIFSVRFLDHVHAALEPGGRLSVMTDHRDYFLEMLRLAEADPRWEKAHDERYLVGFEPGVKSRFQRLWEGYGLATLRFELRKPVEQ